MGQRCLRFWRGCCHHLVEEARSARLVATGPAEFRPLGWQVLMRHSFARRVNLVSSPVANFDRLAPHYYWLECLLAGRMLQRCRTAFLDQARTARSALIVGEGNGRFLRELLKVNREAVVVCVDESTTMLNLARQRVRGFDPDRVRFVQADVLAESQWGGSPPATFDLVATHFFLDCFRPDQLRDLVAAIAARTCAEATWLLADFQVPKTGLRKRRAQLILWLAYAFFRIVTRLPAHRLTAPDSFLEANGFKLAERRLYEAGLLHSDL